MRRLGCERRARPTGADPHRRSRSGQVDDRAPACLEASNVPCIWKQISSGTSSRAVSSSRGNRKRTSRTRSCSRSSLKWLPVRAGRLLHDHRRHHQPPLVLRAAAQQSRRCRTARRLCNPPPRAPGRDQPSSGTHINTTRRPRRDRTAVARLYRPRRHMESNAVIDTSVQTPDDTVTVIQERLRSGKLTV